MKFFRDDVLDIFDFVVCVVMKFVSCVKMLLDWVGYMNLRLVFCCLVI